MCGIAGIIDTSGFNTDILYNMSATIRHRGPDDEGFLLVDTDYKVSHAYGDDSIEEVKSQQHIKSFAGAEKKTILGLVHRRLSIIDLSAHGHQPMTYDNARFQIVFNGEVYNYKEIKHELAGKGYKFESDSDTEVILASYKEWGADCVQRFMGMWVFAIYDTEKRTLFISRDRYGIKPLYYSYKNNRFVFASEIKAILQDEKIQSKINSLHLFQYVSFGKISDAYGTLFNDIIELPVGHNVLFDLNKNKLDIFSYYDFAASVEKIKATIGKNYFEEYAARFDESIMMHLRADVPIGTCLSGGLDSSAIIAYAAPKLRDTIFNSFTAVFDDAKIDESKFAKMVSGHFSNIKPFYIQPTSKNYWNDLDKLIWHQDMPIASTSMYAQWEVMKLARQHGMKVLLDGQGADETLGGYSIFTGVYLMGLLKKMRFAKLFSESQQLKNSRSVGIANEMGRAAFYYMPEFVKKIVRSKARSGSSFISENFQKQFAAVADSRNMGTSYLEMSLQYTKYGMHDLLRYEDRNSMAFSIESRVPFLDHRLVEFTLALPDDAKMQGGWTKYVLRKTIDKKVPDEIVWRTDKKGFVTPQKNWMLEIGKPLRDYITSSNIPTILNRKNILASLDNPALNAAQVSEFWKAIAVIKWAEVFKVSE